MRVAASAGIAPSRPSTVARADSTSNIARTNRASENCSATSSSPNRGANREESIVGVAISIPPGLKLPHLVFLGHDLGPMTSGTGLISPYFPSHAHDHFQFGPLRL